MRALLILLVVAAGLLVACAPETKTSENTVVLYAPKQVEEPETVHTFELRFNDPFLEPSVMVVEEGNTVEIIPMLEKPVFISIGDQVNDYYDTGIIRFTAEESGEYPITCSGCARKIVGYLVVQ